MADTEIQSQSQIKHAHSFSANEAAQDAICTFEAVRLVVWQRRSRITRTYSQNLSLREKVPNPPAYKTFYHFAASMPSPTEYTVGWTCAVEDEYLAACVFLDDQHPPLAAQDANDHNVYTLGRIGKHNIAIACLPIGKYGSVNATSVAKDMLRTFPNIRFGLMVGIGGGVPTVHDIRLGDVVVSTVDGADGAVLQYDFGKTIQEKQFQMTGHLDAPPHLLTAAVQQLNITYKRYGHTIDKQIATILDHHPHLKQEGEYQRPDPDSDVLYKNNVIHDDNKKSQSCRTACGTEADLIVARPTRRGYVAGPRIHYGLIASGNQLMKDAKIRDALAKERNVLCFEMEAAGLMNHFKCLVIRGICDYSDSHKNNDWQGYAAMTAAAYAKDLLNTISPNQVEAEGKLMLEIKESVQEIRDLTQATAADNRLESIHKWLSPSDPSTNQNRALAARFDGTGQWLLNSEAYRTWRTKPTSDAFLWLNGKPGCGKTVLSSTIIQDLDAENEVLLYFFFDFSDKAKQTLEDMLRSLLYQLYCQSPDARAPLDALHTACKYSRPDVDTMISTFSNMAHALKRLPVVLDALDECTERRQVLAWMKDVRKDPAQVQLITTSRTEYEIESKIRGWASSEEIISLSGTVMDTDISRFIYKKVNHGEELSRWRDSPNVQKEIVESLQKKADGMFRWVTCQLTLLEGCYDYRELRDALDSLPESLDETYARILYAIPANRLDKAIRILQFLTFSRTLLTIEELIDGIAVRPAEKPAFQEKDRLPVPDEVLRYCSSLVIVVIIPNYGDYQDELKYERVLQLSHYSVKEWLISDRLPRSLASHFCQTNARGLLAQICITYLLSLQDAGEYTSTKDSKTLRRKYPLYRYAFRYWAFYGEAAGNTDETVLELMTKILLKGAYVEIDDSWSPFTSRAYDLRAYDRSRRSPLTFAAHRGWFEVSKRLLKAGKDLNSPEVEEYHTPLVAASEAGHLNIVRLFLDHQAFVNARGGSDETALGAASGSGHLEVIMLLLHHQADVNARSDYPESALARASLAGHEKIVELLLDRGAKVNAPNRDVSRALRAAVVGGHEAVIRLLVKRGADLDTRDNVRGETLCTAVTNDLVILARAVAQGAEGTDYTCLKAVFGHDFAERLGSASKKSQEAFDEVVIRVMRVMGLKLCYQNKLAELRKGALQ